MPAIAASAPGDDAAAEAAAGSPWAVLQPASDPQIVEALQVQASRTPAPSGDAASAGDLRRLESRIRTLEQELRMLRSQIERLRYR